MSDAYSLELRKTMLKASKINRTKLFEGIYTMFPGPNFETPAEIKALKKSWSKRSWHVDNF